MPGKTKEPSITTDDVAAIIAPGIESVAAEDAVPEAGESAAKPVGPKFGMCEGTREELARTGRAIDPFTGAVLIRDDPEVDSE